MYVAGFLSHLLCSGSMKMMMSLWNICMEPSIETKRMGLVNDNVGITLFQEISH